MLQSIKRDHLLKVAHLYSKHHSTNAHNTNEVGVQMIDEKLRRYLFGSKLLKDSDLIERAKEHLKKFDLLNKNVDYMKEIDSLKLPKLKGSTIEEHFIQISTKSSEKYFKLLSIFIASDIPKMPDKFSFQPGWTR